MKRRSLIASLVILLLCLTTACGRKGPDAPPDTTPPTIIATDPGVTNSDAWPPNSAISVTFSEVVDQSTISFVLTTGTTTVPCTMSYSGTTATFTPLSPLSYNTLYTARVMAGIQDLAGNAMTNDDFWGFMTSAALDTTPPSVSANTPANNATNVVPNAALSVTFSEPVNQQTITFTLSAGGTTVPCTISYSGTTAIITPSTILAYGTQYTATVKAGVTDLAGNPMPSDYSWTFTTGGVGATTMTLTAPAVTYGKDGSVTVTVSSAAGTPTGDVSLIVDNGTPITITQTLAGGSTTFTISSPSAGSYNLSAAYAAQGNFGASSAPGTLIVIPAATTTMITAPVVTDGADGIVTVTVSAGTLIPTGNVSLIVDGGPAVVQDLTGGSTAFTITRPSIGSHALIATYAAQGNFGASSVVGTLGVGVGATTMTLSAPTVTYSTNGSVTVTVSSPTGTPTGGVSLIVDNGAATTQGLINGFTTFTITSPSAGTHTLFAAYAAQGNFGASSTSGALLVNQAATTTIITAPAVSYGTDGSVTVTVSSAAGTPTGDVSLIVDNGTPITQTLAGGSTTFTISSPSVGSYNLSAAYAAQGNFDASATYGTLTVSQASTLTDVTSSLNPSNFGDTVTFTATVTPSTATGTVTFKDDTTVLGTGTVSGGVATFSTSALTGGVHSITAEYGGDPNFVASTSSVLSQTVNYAIIATAYPHGSISPSGTVSVSSGADQTFTITPHNNFSIAEVLVDGVSQGPVASYTFTSVTANHTIDATFQ